MSDKLLLNSQASTKTNALQSATTTINVSSATAPTTGQVLTATSGTTATWQTPSSGGMTLLNSSSLSSDGTSLTSSTFMTKNHLLIKVYIPSKNANDFNSFACLRFNSDTGASYATTFTVNGGAASNDNTQTHMLIEYISGTPTVNVSATTSDINISNLNGYYKYSRISSSGRNDATTGVYEVDTGVGRWNNTNQITSITLTTRGGTANMATGTRLDIYGID